LIFIFLGEGFSYFCCIATRAKGVKPLLVAVIIEPVEILRLKHQQRLRKIVKRWFAAKFDNEPAQK